MTRLHFVLALLAPALAVAQTPPPVATAPPKAAPIAGISPAGMAIVDKYRGAGDTALPGLVRQQRQAHQQLIAATLVATIDPDRVATLLKADEAAQVAVRSHLNDQMIAVVRALPEADRAPFLRSLIRPTSPAPAVR